MIQDREYAYKIDFINENLEFNGNSLVIEFGAKSSRRIKSNRAGNYDASGDVLAGLLNYSPYSPNKFWYFPQKLSFFADPDAVYSLQNQVRKNLVLNPADYWRSQENINAFYVMGTIRYPNSVLVTGFRNESTIFNTTGFNNSDISDPLNFKNS